MSHLRLHKSSIVVGFIASLLLVLICIPGRVVDWQPYSFMTFEHGWPIVYLRRETQLEPMLFGDPIVFNSRRDALTQLPMGGIPWLSLANWRIWEANAVDGIPHWEFSGRTLAVDCFLVLVVVVAIVAVYEFRRRRRKSAFSFSLGDMFIVVTLVCAALGWVAHLEHESKREMAITARFDDAIGPFVDDEVCIVPDWIRALAGDTWMPGFAWRVASLDVSSLDVKNIDQWCDEIRRLSCLKKLVLMGSISGGDHFPFATLRSISQLETLRIENPPTVDDRDVRELSQLTGLKRIAISQKAGIAPDRLLRLESALPNCKVVDADEGW